MKKDDIYFIGRSELRIHISWVMKLTFGLSAVVAHIRGRIEDFGKGDQITETKLLHFHRIFKNRGWGGGFEQAINIFKHSFLEITGPNEGIFHIEHILWMR